MSIGDEERRGKRTRSRTATPSSRPRCDGRLRRGRRATRAAPTAGARGAEQLGLRVGDDVRHEKFGEGVIIDINGSGDKAEAIVRFPRRRREAAAARVGAAHARVARRRSGGPDGQPISRARWRAGGRRRMIIEAQIRRPGRSTSSRARWRAGGRRRMIIEAQIRRPGRLGRGGCAGWRRRPEIHDQDVDAVLRPDVHGVLRELRAGTVRSPHCQWSNFHMSVHPDGWIAL